MKLYKNLSHALFICLLLMGMQNALHASKHCSIDLQYIQIKDDLWETEAEAIQHQFEWQQFVAQPTVKELEFVKNFVIPVRPEFSENEADPRSSVYGYHRDGTLDLTGGPKKSYERGFKEFNLRYHVAFEGKFLTSDPLDPVNTQPLSFLTPKAVKNVYKHNIPYFVQRGFDIQGEDIPAKFKDQFIGTLCNGKSFPYFALRLIWKNKYSKHNNRFTCTHSSSDIPAFVDLHASSNTFKGEFFVLDTYKRNKIKQKNGYGYPTRIPVTTDFCRFEKLYDKSPIAFYDKSCHVLTIHVPKTDSNEHFLTRRVINIGSPIFDVDYIEHLAGFDGSFKVFCRDECDQLIPSNFKHPEVFAQVSEFVNIRSRIVNNPGNGGEPVFMESVNPIRTAVLNPAVINYTGIVANSMNGESKAYDNYTVPFPIINSYVNLLDPIQIDEEKDCHSAIGNNPVTKVMEKFSSLSSTTFFDFSVWNLLTFRLPFDVLKGKSSFPENASSTAIPTDVSAHDAFILVNAHEFTHQTQFASGTISFLPTEGMAVGIELDTHASGEIFGPYRAGVFTQRLISTTRGEFTAMRPDSLGLNTYGMGIWWKYIQDQFDYNNQAMRRTMDILSSETLGPLLSDNHFPDSFAAAAVNDVGGSAALDQALEDLFGKNIKDVWNDYSISITLLRNNRSIPPQWRHDFPYWIYNSEYSGYSKIFNSLSIVGAEMFANWWENMNENAVIPAEYGLPNYTGETFIRTLPDYFETDALSLRTFAFNVTKPNDGGPNKIKVKVPQGEWRVTLVQFTSDGTRKGSFIADGPHTLIAGSNDSVTLNLSNHNPAFSETGNIRLICVNVTFNGRGKQLADYFTEETPNGRIIIKAPVENLALQRNQKGKKRSAALQH